MPGTPAAEQATGTVDVPVALTLRLTEQEQQEQAMNTSTTTPFWKQPAIYITAMIMPLVYIVVIQVLSGNYSAEIKAMVITAVVSGALGAITGFWLASSYGSSKKDDALASAASAAGGPGIEPGAKP